MTESLEPEFADELKALGERIKLVRKEQGLSVRDMVVHHNYHDAQWRRYEKGAALTVPSLMRIAKALGTSVTILLDGIGEFSSAKVDDIKGSLTIGKTARGVAKKS